VSLCTRAFFGVCARARVHFHCGCVFVCVCVGMNVCVRLCVGLRMCEHMRVCVFVCLCVRLTVLTQGNYPGGNVVLQEGV